MKKIIAILILLFAVSVCIGEVSSHRSLKYLGGASFNFSASDSDDVKYSGPIDLSGMGAIAEAAAGVARTDSVAIPIFVSWAAQNYNLKTTDSVRVVSYLVTSPSKVIIPSTSYVWQVDSVLVPLAAQGSMYVDIGSSTTQAHGSCLSYFYVVEGTAQTVATPAWAYLRASLAKGDSCRIRVSVFSLE